jgi:hypothetical protein
MEINYKNIRKEIEMDKFFFSNVYFDLENIVYSAWNRLNERVLEGRMDWAYRFSAEQIAPHVVDTIKELLHGRGYGHLISTAVVAKSNKHLVEKSGDKFWNVIVVPEPIKNPKGAQVADEEILGILYDIDHTATGDMGVVVVSGDGCYIDELVRLFKLGYIVGAVSTEWSLHGDYVKELGKHSVMALDESWLDEVIRRTRRSLPLVGLYRPSYRRRIYHDRNAGI